jgi:anti-sigma-K factor RskA
MAETDQHDDDLALLATLRTITDDDRRLVPAPPGLWDRIAAECAADASANASAPSAPPSSGASGTVPTAGRRGGWRSPAAWRIVVGAAAAIVALGGGFLALANRGDDPDERIVATAALSSDGLDTAPPGRTGEAEVVETGSAEIIKVDVGDLTPTSGEFLEVWLIKSDLSGLVSLGALRDDGEYEIPDGLSLSDYSIVDVSTEPHDGNPDHSGLSLLRGQLS